MPAWLNQLQHFLCFHYQVFSLPIFISKYPHNPNSLLHYLSLKYKGTHPPNSCLKRPILQPELKSVGSYILCFHHQVFSLSIFISKYSYNPNSLLHYLSLKYKCTHPPNSWMKRPILQQKLKPVGSSILCFYQGLYSPPTFHRESIWNPYHSRWIPPIPHGMLSQPFWWFHSIYIPHGFHHFIWNDALESTWNYDINSSTVPSGFHPIPHEIKE